jgi:hypothetical protein
MIDFIGKQLKYEDTSFEKFQESILEKAGEAVFRCSLPPQPPLSLGANSLSTAANEALYSASSESTSILAFTLNTEKAKEHFAFLQSKWHLLSAARASLLAEK